MNESLKLQVVGEKLTRAQAARARIVDQDARTAVISFSSEAEYERAFGIEILDHSPEAVDLSRLKTVGSLLVEHDPTDIVGVIEDAWIENRRGYARVRFGRSDRAFQVFRDVADGIRRATSVGYRIDAMEVEDPDGTKGLPTYRATRWTPYEVSLVSIPADVSVGVGRNTDPGKEPMKTQQNGSSEKEPRSTASDDKARVRAISELGRMHHEEAFALEHVEKGSSVDEFRAALLERKDRNSGPHVRVIQDNEIDVDLEGRGFGNDRGRGRGATLANEPAFSARSLGIGDREMRRYSLRDLMRSLSDPNHGGGGFERAVSAALEKSGHERRHGGVLVPSEVFQTRAMSTSAGAGSEFVGTEVRGFIESLKEESIV